MDNHIKELQREAFRLCKKVSYAGSERPPTVVTDEWFEQFAKLILLDVKLLIADERMVNETAKVDEALVNLLLSIENHFGVE